MGYLIHILLALVLQGVDELSDASPRTWPLAVVALLVAPYLLGALTRRAYMAGRFRLAALSQTLVVWSPVLLHALALLVFGWNRSVERVAGQGPSLLAWPHPSLLLSLLPFAAYMLASIDCRARAFGVAQRGGVRRFHLRMFLTGLVPLTGFVLASWVIGLRPSLRVNLEEVSLYQGAFAALTIGLFLWLLPWVVRNVWDTRPMPRGFQRNLVEALASHVGLRCSEILVWGTGNQMSNAAVVGVGPQRVVLLSDALLSELPPRELAAVFAHEAAHVKCRHVLIFLAWSVAFFVGADLVTIWAGVESELVAAGIVAVVFVLWYLAFGWLSRRFELEADLWSARTTADPAALASALERVGSTHGRRTGWRHFGTDDRIAFLQNSTFDPAVGARLQSTLRRAARLGVLAMLLALSLEVWTLWLSLDEDRLRVDLRLGNYVSAMERLDRIGATGGDELEAVRRSVVRALDLPEPRSAEALVDAAREARQGGDERAFEELVELARMRGLEAGAAE